MGNEFWCMEGCINVMAWARSVGGIALAVEGNANDDRTGILESTLLDHWTGWNVSAYLSGKYGAPGVVCSLEEVGDENALRYFLPAEAESEPK